jgi:hypothetical protein
MLMHGMKLVEGIKLGEKTKAVKPHVFYLLAGMKLRSQLFSKIYATKTGVLNGDKGVI